MQICTFTQTHNHASIPSLSFLQARCPCCRPTNSIKSLKAVFSSRQCRNCKSCFIWKTVTWHVFKTHPVFETGLIVQNAQTPSLYLRIYGKHTVLDKIKTLFCLLASWHRTTNQKQSATPTAESKNLLSTTDTLNIHINKYKLVMKLTTKKNTFHALALWH